MKYEARQQYRNIKRLADRDCKKCLGRGVVMRHGNMVATEEVEVSHLVDGLGSPIVKKKQMVYMTCSCVRQNLRRERSSS